MEAESAPRVNLITGDNGLGKSFLLDSMWWAVTSVPCVRFGQEFFWWRRRRTDFRLVADRSVGILG